MYICNECKSVFDDTDRELMNSVDYYREYADVCPHCRSNDYEEAVYCPICDEYYSYDDFDGYNEENTNNRWYHHEGDICRQCVEKIFNPELGMEYLKAYDLEKNFYIEYCNEAQVTYAGNLVSVCKENFIAGLENNINRQDNMDLIKDFVFDDVAHFSEWYLDEYVYGKRKAI